ncbi:FAD:protein FMN transferase [uncultured Sulfitobacter sp.]|uniref:FAD:protein FMN transferase n=1 Tax=uncultured Sulfitobacter sp. TaxID=191468 RepID=UPI00260CA98D|nr:FAD:protein FMN transferase [uncultured Sulfitobacter sp.]
MTFTRRTVIQGLAAAGFAPSCLAAGDVDVTGGLAFGSSWRVTAGSGLDKTTIPTEVAAIIDQVDKTMSPYLAQSDLSRFNTAAATDWQEMPRSLCEVVYAALDVAKLTDGAFDPTVGPLVSRYGFGPIAGGMGQFRDIHLRAAALKKTVPDLTLDLCGIAKGYALDRITSRLQTLGLTDALIEVGGEVRAIGQHPSGRSWQVAVSDPTAVDFGVRRIVAPGALALATSGHVANGISGQYSTSHIIDPYVRTPANTSLVSVTVLAPTAMRADALATALCAVGPEVGTQLAQRLNISALFITDGTAAAVEVLTGDFAHHLLI